MKEWVQSRSFIKDRDLRDELQDLAAKGQLRAVQQQKLDPKVLEKHIKQQIKILSEKPVKPPDPTEELKTPSPPRPSESNLEAIVRDFMRPSLLIRNGTFEIPESPKWRQTLALSLSRVESAIARVGRVELINHLGMEWVGTAWLVRSNVVITNRHVAEEFATRDDEGSFVFKKNFVGVQYGSKIDFREEHENPKAAEVKVRKILYVAATNDPDIALLELQIEPGIMLPDPIPLSSKKVTKDQLIGVIGYPAFDSRNPIGPMRRYFGDIFDVKRFAPGIVSFEMPNEYYFVHDCTTLGGNSGSKVIDLDSGEVVGLHFAGRYGEGNFAVKANFIKDALTSVSITVPELKAIEELPKADGEHPAEYFEDRDGYLPNFLGSESNEVPLPGFGDWANDAAPVAGAPNEIPYVLRYRHFSVVISKSRKLPILTAVNIDGDKALKVYRRGRDKWFVDGRIDLDFQTGNELYLYNDLDRGHMVRREDPVWGTKKLATQANEDTFHYTNAAPQHKDLNQKTWLALEDLVLKYAKAKDMKITVLTGPVMKNDDREYRHIKLPREFWKIVILVDEDTEKLSALGFILTHSTLIRNLEEAIFIPNHLRVYQKTIADIGQLTGLDFGSIEEFDPLAHVPEVEMIAGIRGVLIESGEEIVLNF